MGCNCGKSRIAASMNKVQKVTVYQAVSPSNSVVEEFNTLSDARIKATEIGGRVRVTSKNV